MPIVIENTHTFKQVLNSSLDPPAKHLLEARRDQLLADTGGDYDLEELVRFVIAAPGDTISQIEEAAGAPVVKAGLFEWVELGGGWFEAAAVLSDDGYGVVLLAPDVPGVDPTLLETLRDQAKSVNPALSASADRDQPTAP
jgi:hypothetical protein